MKNTSNVTNEKGQEFKLPKELQDEAIQVKKNLSTETNKSSIFSHPATYLTMLTAALTMASTTPATSQTKDNPNNIPTFSIEMVKNYLSIKYVVDNFDSYFKDPEMKKHLEEMIAKMGNRKEGVEQALKATLMNLKDPKQKIAGSILSIEDFVLFTKGFGDKYNEQITDETIMVTEEFNKIYDTRMDAELERLNKIISDAEKGILSEFKKSEEILKNFSPEQVKKDSRLQQGLIKLKKICKEENYSPSAHTQKLLNLVP